MKRSGKLRQRSKKTAEIYRIKRVPLVIKMLELHPLCEICFVNESCDVHEIKTRGRTGGVRSTEWLDESNLLVLCRKCHTWVTNNPDEALLYGWVDKGSN